MAMRKEKPIENESEQSALRRLDFVLKDTDNPPKLSTSYRTEIEIPEAVMQGLRKVVHCLRYAGGFTIIPAKKEVTTQEAADILNVSRPFLVKLLEEGKIPYGKVGSHRRIPLD